MSGCTLDGTYGGNLDQTSTIEATKKETQSVWQPAESELLTELTLGLNGSGAGGGWAWLADSKAAAVVTSFSVDPAELATRRSFVPD